MKKTWIILTVALSTMAVTIPAFASHKGYTHDEVRTQITTEATTFVEFASEYTQDEVRTPIVSAVARTQIVLPSHVNMEMNDAHLEKK